MNNDTWNHLTAIVAILGCFFSSGGVIIIIVRFFQRLDEKIDQLIAAHALFLEKLEFLLRVKVK